MAQVQDDVIMHDAMMELLEASPDTGPASNDIPAKRE